MRRNTFFLLRRFLPRLPRAVHVVVHVVLLPGSTASSLATRLKYVFSSDCCRKITMQCKMKWEQKIHMMSKFKFLRVSIFGPRHHHRHRVYYHHGPLSSSYNVPLGQGRPSRQVLPSVVSPCSTRWCTSRRSPLLQQLQLIFTTNFNSIVTKTCEESQERQGRTERQEQGGKETQEKTF